MTAIQEASPAVRYIKLGAGSRWAKRSLENGEIHFGHHRVPHELALNGDREALITYLIGLGRTPGKAADFAREVLDFYMLGEDTIWITFQDGLLWWARADAEVIWIGDSETTGARMRRTIGGWRNKDLGGKLLRQDGLSTQLTKVAGYRQTLCEVAAVPYLLRKIAGVDEPIVIEAIQAREALLVAAGRMLAALHWPTSRHSST